MLIDEQEKLKDVIEWLESRAEARSVWALDEADGEVRDRLRSERSKLIQAARLLREMTTG